MCLARAFASFETGECVLMGKLGTTWSRASERRRPVRDAMFGTVNKSPTLIVKIYYLSTVHDFREDIQFFGRANVEDSFKAWSCPGILALEYMFVLRQRKIGKMLFVCLVARGRRNILYFLVFVSYIKLQGALEGFWLFCLPRGHSGRARVYSGEVDLQSSVLRPLVIVCLHSSVRSCY